MHGMEGMDAWCERMNACWEGMDAWREGMDA